MQYLSFSLPIRFCEDIIKLPFTPLSSKPFKKQTSKSNGAQNIYNIIGKAEEECDLTGPSEHLVLYLKV